MLLRALFSIVHFVSVKFELGEMKKRDCDFKKFGIFRTRHRGTRRDLFCVEKLRQQT